MALQKYSSDDELATIKWFVADLESILEEKGIPVTDENIQRVLDNRCKKTMEGRSIEEGWEILNVIVDNTDFGDET